MKYKIQHNQAVGFKLYKEFITKELLLFDCEVSYRENSERFFWHDLEVNFANYNFIINIYSVYLKNLSIDQSDCRFFDEKDNLKLIVKNVDKFTKNEEGYNIKYSDLKEILFK